MGNTINLIFGGVDGTGVWNDKNYERTFEESHVHTLWKNWGEGPKEYRRGPVTTDGRIDTWTRLQAYEIWSHVTSHWRNAGKKAVFLAGYSRGGAAVIEVAKWLKDDNIPVECLILFDPVDRTAGVGLPWRNTPIVSTVKHVIRVLRDPAAESRESFDNCGKVIEDRSKTKLSPGVYRGTHGAIGGVPWTEPKDGGYIDEGPPDGLTTVTVVEDRAISNQVKEYVFGLVRVSINNCKQRLAEEDQTKPHPDFQVTPQVGGSLPPTGGGFGKQRIYIVKPGDWLSKIAQQYYGDMNKWKFLYYDIPENRKEIGPDPNLIKPGQKIIVPYL